MATDFTDRNAQLIARNREATDSVSADLNQRLDSLNVVKEMLADDIKKSQSILSDQWALPGRFTCQTDTTLAINKDYVRMYIDNERYIVVHNSVDTSVLRKILPKDKSNNILTISPVSYKIKYAFTLSHFPGFLLSILALSLGAPFWFDLLNKLIKLRTSNTAGNSGGESASTGMRQPGANREILNRVG